MGGAKKILILVLFLGIIGGAIYGYLWYKNLVRTGQEAASAIEKAQMFDKVTESINEEQSKCKAIIGAGSGDFTQFQYCSSFMKWSESLPLN